ncbi:MAG: tetratricopeptide repeat protein [Chryseolinea sp.]
MLRLLICTVGIVLSFTSIAQKIPLIDAAEVIGQGKTLYDSGKYAEAIKQYLTIPKRDTAYVDMLAELAITYTANEEYDKAIATTEEALKFTSIHRPHLLRSRAIAMDKKGEYDQSVVLFNQAIEEYPFDFSLIYNLGITYYNHKEYDKARDCFFRTLKLNPFHSGSHLNLGRLSAAQGKKAHAMLSLGLYMGINNSANQWLVFIEKFVSNEYQEENTIPFTGKNAFDKVDQIIKSKIALDKNYKSAVDFDANLVKQYQILFDQLNTVNTSVDDPWVTFYMPIYSALKEQNAIEPFLYHILSSVKGDQVKKWLKKNDKRMDVFFTLTNTTLKKGREELIAPATLGFDKPVKAWYDTNNKLEALGNKDGSNTRNGHWIYFHDNGQRSAEGSYDDKGVKRDVWKFYRSNGTVKSIEDYRTGEVTTYFEDFSRNQHFFLKDEKTQGEVEIYSLCGALEEKLGYDQDKRKGPGASYYSNGAVNIQYQYADDKLTGEYIQYYEDGKLKSKSNYKEGLLEGNFISYYQNGKIKTGGAYVKDEANGPWKYFYFNGKLEKTGAYKNGKGEGEWIFYNNRGQVFGKRMLVNGEINGEDVTYNNEKIHFINTYKNGLLIKVVYLDKNGKELGSYGNDKGNFNSKQFYSTGQLNGEGAYTKGKQSGLWKYYYREGGKLSEYSYVDNQIQGEGIEFFKSGGKKYVSNYVDGERDGYFQEFYPHGQVKHEGWFQIGERQQQWMDYYPDGVIESDYYYLNGDFHSTCYDFNTDGKMYLATQYDKGSALDAMHYNEKGEAITRKKKENNSVILETQYTSGKPQSKLNILCGEYSNTVTKWFPDGKIFYTYTLFGGRRHGAYQYNCPNGQFELKGNYVRGTQEGWWEGYYYNGKKDYEGKYLQGEQDSTWIYYFLKGGIASTSEFKDDEREGLTQLYSADGKVALEKMYAHGDLLSYRSVVDNTPGEWIPFTGDASIVVKYSNGKTAYEENYKKGVLDGVRKVYFSSGQLYSEYHYALGDFTGPYVLYYPNGKVLEKGEYKLDQLNGLIEWFNENGSLNHTENYLLGSRQGKSTWYEKGVKVKEFNFWGGMTDE